MANLKNITDLPIAESVEGLNLIVNDNGSAKQIAANKVGKVKTVNSVEPDENGNVQIDTASSWNDLKDKPFYEEENRTLIVEGIPDHEEGYYFNLNNQLEEGKEYTYIIDGVTYTGTAIWDDTDSAVVVFLDSGSDYSANVGLDYIRLNGFDTTISHKIERIEYVAHKLDTKYLPNVCSGVPTYYVLWDRTNNDAVSTSEGMYDALQKLFDTFEPVNVVVLEKTSDGTIRYLAVDGFYPNRDSHQVNTAQGTVFFIAKNGNHSFYDN